VPSATLQNRNISKRTICSFQNNRLIKTHYKLSQYKNEILQPQS